MLSDALSRREQDLPEGLNDDRLAGRVRQMLEQGEDNRSKLRVYATWSPNADFDKAGEEQDAPSELEL